MLKCRSEPNLTDWVRIFSNSKFNHYFLIDNENLLLVLTRMIYKTQHNGFIIGLIEHIYPTGVAILQYAAHK